MEASQTPEEGGKEVENKAGETKTDTPTDDTKVNEEEKCEKKETKETKEANETKETEDSKSPEVKAKPAEEEKENDQKEEDAVAESKESKTSDESKNEKEASKPTTNGATHLASGEEEKTETSTTESDKENVAAVKQKDRRKSSTKNINSKIELPQQAKAAVHPLQCTWKLWLNNPDRKSQNWEQSQTVVHIFKTVEDFWCLHNNIHGPSKSPGDYSLFVDGIFPGWEDEAVASGGRLKLQIQSPTDGGVIDEIWLVLQLAMVGENFVEKGEPVVAGAVVSYRPKRSKLELWLTTTDRSRVDPVGQKFWELLTPYLGSMKADVTFELFVEKSRMTLFSQ